MEDKVLVLCTCESSKEASTIARALVESRLAACVQTVSPITSTYWWNGKVETSAEILLLIKTSAERFESVKEKIEALHSYQVPEVIALPIVKGSEKYMSWLGNEIGG
jgi:periplasmic divalent cation tolerance protein